MKQVYTHFQKTLPTGDLIWLALIWLAFSKSSQIVQPTSNHLKSATVQDQIFQCPTFCPRGQVYFQGDTRLKVQLLLQSGKEMPPNRTARVDTQFALPAVKEANSQSTFSNGCAYGDGQSLIACPHLQYARTFQLSGTNISSTCNNASAKKQPARAGRRKERPSVHNNSNMFYPATFLTQRAS